MAISSVSKIDYSQKAAEAAATRQADSKQAAQQEQVKRDERTKPPPKPARNGEVDVTA